MKRSRNKADWRKSLRELRRKLYRLDKRKGFVVLFILIGITTLIYTKAATPTAHFEAENSTLTTNASVASDTGASGGQYLKFNAPSGTSSCDLPNYPDETCTGVQPGVTLTNISGDVTINTANTTYENKNVSGCILIGNVSGITIRNIKAKCLYNEDRGHIGMRVLVEDSEFNCGGTGGSTAISEANITLRRVEITNCENGMDVNQYITIEDSYIHELYENAAIDTHTDGIQTASGHFENGNIVYGAREIVIRHNTIYDYNRVSQLHGTSAIITNNTNDGPGSTNLLIQDNLLAGGSYSLYCNHPGAGNNVRVINNHFSRIFSQSVAAFGPWTDCEDEAQVTGNVYHETGLPVQF